MSEHKSAGDININMASDDTIHIPITPMYIKNVPGKGRGVYAGEDIPSRTLINISPLLLFPENSSSSESSTMADEKDGGPHLGCPGCPERDILAHYTYSFGSNTQALALGMGSMFNHSKRNNVGFIVDRVNLLIRYTTVSNVAKDTELLINYGNRLWFVDGDSHERASDTDSDDLNDPFGNMEL
jgi:hypothetical protein